MSVEQYSNDVIVVTIADGPSNFKVWLREETPADLLSDLRWLCEEYMDSHVVLDLADLGSLEAASYKLMLDLQELVEESDFRFVLCGVSPHRTTLAAMIHLMTAMRLLCTGPGAISVPELKERIKRSCAEAGLPRGMIDGLFTCLDRQESANTENRSDEAADEETNEPFGDDA